LKLNGGGGGGFPPFLIFCSKISGDIKVLKRFFLNNTNTPHNKGKERGEKREKHCEGKECDRVCIYWWQRYKKK
jgi:hypothetical protein